MIPPSGFAPVAVVTRGGLVESWHSGAAAVVEPGGRLVARVGSPAVATFARSAAKPFQALPLVLAGGGERFGLGEAELALVCASHAGTPAHVELAAGLLERGGFAVEDLECGAHLPLDEPSARRLLAAGEAPSALHNNCSGKHAGMLLACRVLGLPARGYSRPEHPLQRRILALVAGLAGRDESGIGLGTDGCSLPTFRLPLVAAARAYAALADPAAAGAPPEVAAALRRVASAMAAAPEMVAGPGRFTTRLMQATGGRIVGKEGAEGFYCAAVRGPALLGVALKIADGGERCRAGAVLEVLRQLGCLASEEAAALAEFHRPAIHNHRGLRVGEVVPELELEDGDDPANPPRACP
jgi:L-asparaginase II